jgi:hypothetical protein
MALARIAPSNRTIAAMNYRCHLSRDLTVLSLVHQASAALRFAYASLANVTQLSVTHRLFRLTRISNAIGADDALLATVLVTALENKRD